VEALSLTFGQFYQILDWCKSQFVFQAARHHVRAWIRSVTCTATLQYTSPRSDRLLGQQFFPQNAIINDVILPDFKPGKARRKAHAVRR
jgi:hypothetical protein